MNCPTCHLDLETQKLASVSFDICRSCLGVWLPFQAVSGIVAERGMSAEDFASNLAARLHSIERTEYTDALTGLGNRRFFDRQLSAELERARGSHYLSLVLLDLDGFKAANDSHGHATGDLVLRDFGRLLSDVVRRNDFAARVGGDEFALILPESDEPSARAIADRIIERTAAHAFRTLAGHPLQVPIRVSCGTASYPPDLEPSSDLPTTRLRHIIYELADRALYAAKLEGRNRTVSASSLAAQGS